MDTMILELVKISPICAILVAMWYYQKKDYTKLVDDNRVDSKEREEKLQSTISKNQEVIITLAEKFDVVEVIKKDVINIEEKVNKLLNECSK